MVLSPWTKGHKIKVLKPQRDLALDKYNSRQAAAYIGCTEHRLWRFRNTIGGGPIFTEHRGKVSYTKADLDKWLAQQEEYPK